MDTYPCRLQHQVLDWVSSGETYHIRIRAKSDNLTQPHVAGMIIHAAAQYHQTGRWFCHLFLLMPDHLHALLAFPPQGRMGATVGAWKGFLSKSLRIEWQSNFFDHRIRNPASLEEKATYILRNPLVKNLCRREEDWRWIWRPGTSASGGRAPPKRQAP